jgi:hypothetical protein
LPKLRGQLHKGSFALNVEIPLKIARHCRHAAIGALHPTARRAGETLTILLDFKARSPRESAPFFVLLPVLFEISAAEEIGALFR